jgi:hypothetical protein
MFNLRRLSNRQTAGLTIWAEEVRFVQRVRWAVRKARRWMGFRTGFNDEVIDRIILGVNCNGYHDPSRDPVEIASTDD